MFLLFSIRDEAISASRIARHDDGRFCHVEAVDYPHHIKNVIIFLKP